MEPTDEIQLIQQVGVWAKKNFEGKRFPHLGITEEIGEAVHCVLKNKQGIRGFEDQAFFIEHLTDALADTIIYLCDWCVCFDAFFKFGRNMHEQKRMQLDDEPKVIIHLLQGSAAIIAHGMNFIPNDPETPTSAVASANALAQRIATGIELWAAIYSIDIRMAVSATWAKVSKRDWVTDPVNAGNK